MKTIQFTVLLFFLVCTSQVMGQGNLEIECTSTISDSLVTDNNVSVEQCANTLPLKVRSSSNNLAARFDYSNGDVSFEFFVNPADGFSICESNIWRDSLLVACGEGVCMFKLRC